MCVRWWPCFLQSYIGPVSRDSRPLGMSSSHNNNHYSDHLNSNRGNQSSSGSIDRESQEAGGEGNPGYGLHSTSTLRGEGSDAQSLDVASSFYLSWQSDSGQEIQRKLLMANKFLATQVRINSIALVPMCVCVCFFFLFFRRGVSLFNVRNLQASSSCCKRAK